MMIEMQFYRIIGNMAGYFYSVRISGFLEQTGRCRNVSTACQILSLLRRHCYSGSSNLGQTRLLQDFSERTKTGSLPGQADVHEQ